MQFIGLGHYKRTGKDSFANYLIDEVRSRTNLRIVKRSLAWKLKQICYELYAWAGHQTPEWYDTKEGEHFREVVLPAIGLSPRDIWIKFGTDAVRDNVYRRTWLDYLLKSDHDADIVVVPDVRFPDEAKAFQEAGAHLVKIVRPGYGPQAGNLPDCALWGWTCWNNVIGEDGKMDTLKAWAQQYTGWLVGLVSEPRRSPEMIADACAVEVAP